MQDDVQGCAYMNLHVQFVIEIYTTDLCMDFKCHAESQYAFSLEFQSYVNVVSCDGPQGLLK